VQELQAQAAAEDYRIADNCCWASAGGLAVSFESRWIPVDAILSKHMTPPKQVWENQLSFSMNRRLIFRRRRHLRHLFPAKEAMANEILVSLGLYTDSFGALNVSSHLVVSGESRLTSHPVSGDITAQQRCTLASTTLLVRSERSTCAPSASYHRVSGKAFSLRLAWTHSSLSFRSDVPLLSGVGVVYRQLLALEVLCCSENEFFCVFHSLLFAT
jgi:hypothetical protein